MRTGSPRFRLSARNTNGGSPGQFPLPFRPGVFQRKIVKLNISSKTFPNRFAFIDDEDFPLIKNIRWSVSEDGINSYAIGWKSMVGNVLLHRIVMRAKKGQRIDHRNGDGLDCRKKNLRFCTHSQNMVNRFKRVKASSKFLGVYFDKRKNIFIAETHKDGKRYRKKSKNEVIAARKYNEMALTIHGEFARLNDI